MRYPTARLAALCLVVVLLASVTGACTPAPPAPPAATPAAAYDGSVPITWFSLSLALVKETPGFSPPVASRAFAYMGVALYETVRPGMDGYATLAGQLNELDTLPQLDDPAGYHWALAANRALAETVRAQFPTASAENLTAVAALEEERVRRIVLVRPAVEAGERLGFLPGDMSQKVDPYLRPMYDALYEMMGFDRVARLIERNIIEVAPLAFMRGRSLNESFVILDEAQNTSIEQMKMLVTRLGFGSCAVITGDLTQIDLPRHQVSGLRHATQVLQGVVGINFTYFTAGDVVRHALVQRIVEAYQRFETAAAPKEDERRGGG